MATLNTRKIGVCLVNRMREFIYISPEKLDSFMSARSPRRLPRNIAAGGGVAPGPQASISVTASELDDQAKLRAKLKGVVKQINRTVRSYEDENVKPNDWVKFNGEFGYSILDSGRFRLFFVTQTAATLVGEVALLLYGNPKNVLLGKPPAIVSIEELDSYTQNLATFAQDLLDADAADVGKPGLGERRAAAELFFRIASEHHGSAHVEGLAKVRANISGDIGTRYRTMGLILIQASSCQNLHVF